MNPLISIIVPVYNTEDYIENTVKSILNQTYKNIEVILVNDGSKDNSAKVLDKIALIDQRIKVIHKENQGVTLARLDGVRASFGEYIGFIDSDDTIDERMYEILMGNAIKYNADISHCGYQMVFSDGRINYFHNTKQVVIQDKEKGITDLLLGDLVEPGLWNKLYKRDLLISLLNDPLMNYSIKINEDLLMNYLLFKSSKQAIFEDAPLYHYMVRDNSATRTKLNYHRIYDPINVKKMILENITESENVNLIKLSQRVLLSTSINVFNNVSQYKEFVEDAIVIKKDIILQKEISKYLNKKQKILFYLIAFLPIAVYSKIFSVYSKYFQKKVYS